MFRRMQRIARLFSFAALAVSLVSCAGDEVTEVTIELAARVGGEPAACGRSYDVGATPSAWTLEDFRLFVHDVRLVTEDGREVPVALTQDEWQLEDLALLDFESGGAGCPSGTEATNTSIRGTVPEAGPFTGVRFTVGVPFERNHADVSTAPAPLSSTAMFWSWQGGYKFIRIDGRSEALDGGFFLHLGSTGCDGDPLTGGVTRCDAANRMEVSLDGIDPLTQTVVVDAAEVFSGSDLTSNEMAPGCMSGPMDPECPAIFERLGLAAGSTQRLFSVAE